MTIDLDTFRIIRCKAQWVEIDGQTYRRDVDIYPDDSREVRYALQVGRFSEGTLCDVMLSPNRDGDTIRQIDAALGPFPS